MLKKNLFDPYMTAIKMCFEYHPSLSRRLMIPREPFLPVAIAYVLKYGEQNLAGYPLRCRRFQNS